MEQSETISLMPLGTTIEHNGQRLRIVKLLSTSGWTSEVYLGLLGEEPEQKQVAVKVMKSIGLPIEQKIFEEEGLTLASMMYHEDEASKEQRLQLKVAPAYFGQVKYQNLLCLIMEYLQGQEVPKLMERQGRLPEWQALTIAWHLYRTLDILHTRLRKTYIDLKFEDLWWVTGETGQGGQLKLLDFGTLEDIKPGDQAPRGVKRDLLLGGVYLLGMLTGHMLGYSLGRLTERAEPIINQAQTSWGTRQLLRRLLHRNPQARLAVAADVANELRMLASFWGQPFERLLNIAESNLDRARTETDTGTAKAREYAARARAALDIALQSPEARPGQLTSSLSEADQLLKKSDYQERGEEMFNGNAYGDARKIFEEGVLWSDEPAMLRRWAYLAMIGQDVPSETFEKYRQAAKDVLTRMDQGQWKAVKERLDALRPHLGDSDGFRALSADATLFASLDQAEDAVRSQNYRQAAQAYRQALEALERLPAADSVQKEEVGDLRTQAEEMERLEAQRGQARDNMKAAWDQFAAGNFDESVVLTSEAYRLDLKADYILQQLADLMDRSLQAGEFLTALRLAEIGFQDWPIPIQIIEARQMAWIFWQSTQALAHNDFPALSRCLRMGRVAATSQKQPIYLQAAQTLLRSAENQAVQGSDVQALETLAATIPALEIEGAESWVKSLSEQATRLHAADEKAQRDLVDRLISQAVQWVSLDSPERVSALFSSEAILDVSERFHKRFQIAGDLLQRANSIATSINYRLRDLEYLKGQQIELLSRSATGNEQDQRLRQEAQERDFNTLERRFKDLNADFESLADLSTGKFDADLLRKWHNEVGAHLLVFITDVYAYQEHFGAHAATIRSWADWVFTAMDGVGEAIWRVLKEEAEQHIQTISMELQQVVTAFNQGQLAEAQVAVDRLAPRYRTNLEWMALKQQIIQAMAWKEWQMAHREQLISGELTSEILQVLQTYGTLDLPKVYKQSEPVLSFLKRARMRLRERVHSLLPNYQTQEFLDQLRLWGNLEVVAQFYLQDGNHAITK
jgi:serine/threonine protein kinase